MARMATKTRQVTLISGASSGLGEGMARQYAALGRDLALCARRIERLQQLRDELTQLYPSIRVAIAPLDVNDHQQVFDVFQSFKLEFGQLDRIIVNAGMGKGAALGKGHFAANRQTAETNFVAALAQCEAAMTIFYEQGHGHLVTIASMSALRGLPGAMTVYAASKAGLRALSEGIRAELLKRPAPINVSCILPGYIRSEINENLPKTPFMVDNESGCRALLKAIEKEPTEAYVPGWPWRLVGILMKRLPLRWVLKLT